MYVQGHTLVTGSVEKVPTSVRNSTTHTWSVYKGWLRFGLCSVGDVISLLWFKRQLPKYAVRFVEMCVMLCADHGPCVSGMPRPVPALLTRKHQRICRSAQYDVRWAWYNHAATKLQPSAKDVTQC